MVVLVTAAGQLTAQDGTESTEPAETKSAAQKAYEAKLAIGKPPTPAQLKAEAERKRVIKSDQETRARLKDTIWNDIDLQLLFLREEKRHDRPEEASAARRATRRRPIGHPRYGADRKGTARGATAGYACMARSVAQSWPDTRGTGKAPDRLTLQSRVANARRQPDRRVLARRILAIPAAM